MGGDLLDFNERCRLCIEPKRLSIDIFSEEGKRIKLENKINKHLSLKISQSDGLSQQVCYQCLYRLETWVSFKQLCSERDQVMRTWSQTFSKNKINKIKQPQSSSPVSKKPRNEKSNKFSQRRSDVGMETHRVLNVTLKKNSEKDSYDCIPVSKEIVSSYQREITEKKLGADIITLAEKAIPDNNIEKVSCGPQVVADELCNNALILSRESYQGKTDHIKRKHRKSNGVKKSSPNSDAIGQISLVPKDEVDIVKTEFEQFLPTTSNIDHKMLQECSQTALQTNGSPVLLKRKRGRPSKAFLQMERQYKKLKEKETATTSTSFSEVMNTHVAQDVRQDQTSESEPCEHPQAVSQELIPVVNEESGVTEIVLNDPDFGSMKFTLSVVGLDCPVPSPPSTEDYRFHPETCELKEDFEGFDNSDVISSDAIEVPHHQTSEMLSRSLTDVRLANDTDSAHSINSERKRSISASGDYFADYNASAPSSCMDVRSPSMSKSLETLNMSSESYPEKRSHFILDDRMAHSDGEIMEM